MSTGNRSSPTLTKTTTPGIYKRGSRYVVVWRHRGKQHKSFHRTLAEAREAKADHTGSTKQAPQTKAPFDKYALEWVDSCQGRTERGFDEDTRKAYRRAIELYAIPHFGSTRLRDIDRGAVDKLITKLQRQGLSAASIAKYMAPVRAMFSDLVERGALTAHPAVKLRINAKASRGAAAVTKPKRAKLMTRAELAAVIAAIPEQHRLVFEVMAGTGCRISEALGLDCGDLEARGDQTTLRIERQWYRGTLKPNAKTDAGQRQIELPSGLAAKMWDRWADATGPMFQTRTGQRLSDRNLARVLTAASDRAGVFGLSHHAFRHTHGSILLDEGWTLAEVSERLGHADPAITAKVYTRKMSDRRRDLAFLDVDPRISGEEVDPERGNSWATEGPETAANELPAVGADSDA